jgi:class 3 adenylate cyclase
MITKGGLTVSHDSQRPGILALAGAGEILVSATTVGLAADSGLEFEDRGEHELRGIAGRRRIHAIRSASR